MAESCLCIRPSHLAESRLFMCTIYPIVAGPECATGLLQRHASHASAGAWHAPTAATRDCTEPVQWPIASRPAWYPARHGIPHGMVSRTAWHPTRHGIPHGMVSHTPVVPCAEACCGHVTRRFECSARLCGSVRLCALLHYSTHSTQVPSVVTACRVPAHYAWREYPFTFKVRTRLRR